MPTTEKKEKESRFDYLKIRIEKFSIETAVEFVQKITQYKLSLKPFEISIRDYLCFVFYIKELEAKYLKIKEDFSDMLLRWNVKADDDLDYMVITVAKLRNQKGKSLKEFSDEERQNIKVDDEIWDKYLFIDSLIDLDRYKCIDRDLEKLLYVYENGLGVIMIAGLQSINSTSIDQLYNFVKYFESIQGGAVPITTVVPQEKHVNVEVDMDAITLSLQEIENKVFNIQKNISDVKNRIDVIEEQVKQSQIENNGTANDNNMIIADLSDRVLMIENRIDDLVNVINKNSSETEFEGFENRLSLIESRISSLRDEIILEIDQKVSFIMQDISRQQSQNQKTTEETVQQNEENLIYDDTEEESSNFEQISQTQQKNQTNVDEQEVEETKKSKKPLFSSLKLLIIVWVIVFVLFIIIGFMIR